LEHRFKKLQIIVGCVAVAGQYLTVTVVTVLIQAIVVPVAVVKAEQVAPV
jgi:hypothetical protein